MRNMYKCHVTSIISQEMSKFIKLYINSESIRLLQRSKINCIEYHNQIFPNNSHIHLRASDAASLYQLNKNS